jgi:gas vesicle protein
VREILAFLSTFQMPNWDEGKITFNEIREKIHLFTDWNSDIKARIKDISKGCLNINGSKIATNLTRDLDSKLSVYKEQLSKLMVRKMKKCIETIDDDLKILQNPNETLKEYGDFIENYNRINDDNKNLENQKVEIENMQSQLKKLEGSIPS